jgi:hypothetical protein
MFTVAAPTFLSVTLHRTLRTLAYTCPEAPARLRRDLAHARWACLMFGTMAVLSAFAIGLE